MIFVEAIFNFCSLARSHGLFKVFKLAYVNLSSVYFYFRHPRISSLLEPDTDRATRVITADGSIAAILGVLRLSQINYSVICPDVIDMVYLLVGPYRVIWIAYIPC